MTTIEQRKTSLDVSRHELDELSKHATRVVLEYFSTVSQRAVFPDNYAGKTTAAIKSELPLEGSSVEELMTECETVIGLSRHNGHPRFFGYVASPSTPIGAYSDLIASALNSNVTCWRSGPAATEIEKMVVRWLGELIGYDNNARGLLTSGGSMANLIALLIASRRKLGADVARKGLWAAGQPLTIYASEEVHMSIPKAADILNLGRDYVRLIQCDERQRMNVSKLRERIVSDVRDGLRPCCVVGSAGTVATGAVDDLSEVGAIAREFDLWFHVDGAYGVPASMVPAKKNLFAGLGQADSVSLDPHKWLYIPVDAGSLLFRDEVAASSAFNLTEADYIKTHGLSDEAAFAFWDYGIELSRRFRALKVWLTLRYYGARRIAEAIGEDIGLAQYLASLINDSADFELLAPVELSICCFRYVPEITGPRAVATESPGQPSASDMNRLNERIMSLVQKSGRAYVSNATIDGNFALRVCITNFRTTRADIEETLKVIRDAARQALSEII
jgi:aromatic-L-amino-acid decarboxylase